MAVIQGWGACDPHQNETANPGWHKAMLATLKPWKFINHKFTAPKATVRKLMPLVYALQHDIHSAAAMEVLTPGQWVLGGNEGEHGGEGSDVSPEVAAQFSRDWVDTMGPHLIAPGFGLWWDLGFEWADAYRKAGGFFGEVIQVSSFGRGPEDMEGQLQRLEKWKAANKIQATTIYREANAWPNEPDVPRGGVLDWLREQVDSKRLQAVYWFPTWYGPSWSTGSLLNADGSLRFWGKKWIAAGQP